MYMHISYVTQYGVKYACTYIRLKDTINCGHLSSRMLNISTHYTVILEMFIGILIFVGGAFYEINLLKIDIQ